jgi:4-amino-4-deoxy-L-arabinose transferase-like glycosyltransferase
MEGIKIGLANRQLVINPYYLGVLILIAFSVTTKFWLSSKTTYLNEWDERYHALVAKNIASDNSFLAPKLYAYPVLDFPPENWSKSHIWMHKQPLTTWIMALSIKALGVTTTAVRVPSILMAGFSVLLVFLIGRKLFNEAIGIIAACFMSIHGFTNLLSTGKVTTDHVDLYFMFFILLSFYFITKIKKGKKNWIPLLLIGLYTGLAVLVKWLPAYTTILGFLAFNWSARSKKQLFIDTTFIVLVSMTIWAPWQWYAYSNFQLDYLTTQEHNWQHVTQYVENHTNGPFYLLGKSIYLYGEIWIVGITLLLLSILRRPNRELLMIATWIFVPTIFFSLTKTKLPGYTYFTAPAVFLLSSWALYNILQKKFIQKKWARGLIVLALIISPIIRSYESYQFNSINSRPTVDELLTDLGIGERDEVVIFGSKAPINDMFFWI